MFAKLSLFSHGALLFSFTEQLLSYLLQYMVDSMASALSNSDVCLFNSGKLSSCAQASSPTGTQQNAPLRREQGPFQSSPICFPFLWDHSDAQQLSNSVNSCFTCFVQFAGCLFNKVIFPRVKQLWLKAEVCLMPVIIN